MIQTVELAHRKRRKLFPHIGSNREFGQDLIAINDQTWLNRERKGRDRERDMRPRDVRRGVCKFTGIPMIRMEASTRNDTKYFLKCMCLFERRTTDSNTQHTQHSLL